MSSASVRHWMRAGLALVVCAILSGCGFHPLYGGPQQVEADAVLAAVHVEPIPDRIGQLVANALRDTLNPRGATVESRYNLKVLVYASHADLAIRLDGTASRELYVASASFQLAPTKGGPSLSGSARSNNSSDIGENEYSVVVANDDAQTRAARDIAEQISLQVGIFVHQRAAQ
jgi:LPS-assembly lipoprotein